MNFSPICMQLFSNESELSFLTEIEVNNWLNEQRWRTDDGSNDDQLPLSLHEAKETSKKNLEEKWLAKNEYINDLMDGSCRRRLWSWVVWSFWDWSLPLRSLGTWECKTHHFHRRLLYISYDRGRRKRKK